MENKDFVLDINSSNKLENFHIMCKDICVMNINFDTGVYEVLKDELLPWTLKGRIKKVPEVTPGMSSYEITQVVKVMSNNKEAVINWLGSRALSLSRSNAKWIYNLLKIGQVSSNIERAKISIICRAVSLLDNYWVKLESDETDWEHVNLRHNHLNEVVAQVALHGKSLTLQGTYNSPEFTTDGAYAKAWRRQEDGTLWLYKLGEHGNDESRIEVMCSNLLDKMNVEHCHYEADEDDGKYVAKCPLMTDDNKSILSGMDFISYCNVNGMNPDIEMLRIDLEAIYKMWIVDYLISNRDRHSQNWGFYYDADTMEILKCHPLFDHNNAFDVGYMENPDSAYLFGDMTIREAATYAMKKVDFYFTDDIVRDDFITERQYNSFIKRADELGIRTVKLSFEDKLDKIVSDFYSKCDITEN